MSNDFWDKILRLYREELDKPQKNYTNIYDLSLSIKRLYFKELISLFTGTPVIKNYIFAIKQVSALYDQGFRLEIDDKSKITLLKNNVILSTEDFIPIDELKEVLSNGSRLDEKRSLILELFLFDQKTILTLNFSQIAKKQNLGSLQKQI